MPNFRKYPPLFFVHNAESSEKILNCCICHFTWRFPCAILDDVKGEQYRIQRTRT